MNARLRKEARALLPLWAGTLLSSAAPLLAGRSGAGLSWLAFCAGCALLGGHAFGQEHEHRTLPLLLVQPVTRSRLFAEKLLVLAAALVTCTGLQFLLSLALGTPSLFDEPVGIREPGARLLRFVPLAVFCGAPLLTLATGRALGGAVLSLCAAGCCLTLATVASLLVPALREAVVSTALLTAWCPLAALWGYRRFLRYQLVTPRRPALAERLLPDGSAPRSGPLLALLRKELRLQTITLLVVLPLWVLLLLGGLFSPGAHQSLLVPLVTGLDLLVLPLVAGAVALGEERSLGLADWQLTLPPSSRLQWLAKMAVTLPAALLLGLVVPLLLRSPLPGGSSLPLLVLGHLLLTHLALFAGSVTFGTLPALLVALGLWSASAIAVLGWGLLERLGGAGHLAAAMVTLLLLLHGFAFSNFRRRGLVPRRLALQGLSLALAILFFVATA